METVNIDFYRDNNPVVNDSYDRLISKIPLLKQSHGYNLFTITGCEPNVGTTTIAISIAVSLASSGWKTLLVDADVRKGASEKRLSSEAPKGFSDYLKEDIGLSEVLCDTNIGGLCYLSCGSESENPLVLLNSERMNRFIEGVSQNFDYVIFDSSSLNTTVDAAVMTSKTSGAILVVGYMQTRRKEIEVAIRELEQTGGNVIGIVLNKVGKKDYRRYIENYDYFTRKKSKQGRKKRSNPKKKS